MKRFFSRSKNELVDYAEDDFEVMNLDEEYMEYDDDAEYDDDTEYFEMESEEDDEDIAYYEMNEADETEEAEEYYEADEDAEYGEAEEDIAYYEAGAEEDIAYCEAETDEAEEYYETEETDGNNLEYYELDEIEDEEYYEMEDEGSEAYYEMDEYGDGEEYYEDEYYPEDEESRGIGAVFGRIVSFLSNMSSMDRLIASTGALVLIFAIVAGSMYASAKMGENQVAAFASLGNELDDIGVIGESGLLALADVKKAKQEAAALAEEESEEETEEVIKAEIGVTMNLSSIQQDLKIKFINKKSTKLIASVPFEVEVVDADKKTYSLVDEDMDGIIYQNGLKPGEYKVSMVRLEGYEEYDISTEAQKITVKDKIEYKKVDVSDEIKSEAEVNAAAEDTKKQETIESENKDTVAFVESTKTEIGEGGYKEISKATITDPATVAKAPRLTSFLKLSNIATNTVSLKKGESTIVTTSLSGDFITWISDSESVATVDGAQTGNTNSIMAIGAGTTTVTASNGTDTETFQVTVSETQIALDKASATISVGQTVKLTATMEASWTSADNSVATVGNDGVVTGVKAGTTAITATSAEGTTATCMITVTEENKTTISETSLSIKVGEAKTLTATVSGGDKTVAWTTSDAGIAKVEANGSVTGVKAGTATITATANGVSATCTVTVTEAEEKPSVKDDTTTPLKDNSGNQVYIKNTAGEYVAAVYADYYKYDVFYIKTATYKYTGWQTIEGSVYYYDADGNVVKGTQVIQGATYNFDETTGALITSSGILGIDVSKWNGDIDWNAVKNSGVNYVIIRCGYRGSSTGALIEDPKFKTNIKGATAAGLKVGVYFFTQAVNEVEAVEEASMVLSLISGYKISYPVFLDVEPSGGRADSISASVRTAVCNAFSQTITNSGYAAGIYANKTWLNEKINTGGLGAAYKIWLAQYAAKPTYGGKYHLWQYTSKGSVSGIKGNVDMNLSYLGY